MDIPLLTDIKIYKRLENGPILKNDLKKLNTELKNINFGLKNLDNNKKNDLIKYFKHLIKLLDKSINNFNSNKDYRYFKSVLNQLLQLHKNLSSFTTSVGNEHLDQLLETEELDSIIYNSITNNRTKNLSILKGIINEKYENNKVLLVLQDFIRSITNEEYENYLKDDITRKLKRNNNNILYTLLLLVKNANINIFTNLDELLLLLSEYQCSDQVQQIVHYVSISLFYMCDDDCFYVKIVDSLLNNISNSKDNERASTILSHIMYNPFYLDLDLNTSQYHLNNSFVKYPGFKSANEKFVNKSKSKTDERESSSVWYNLINKYIELIKINCNNKLFTKLQINFIKFTTNLYLKTKNNKLVEIIVSLFNNIKSINDPHVSYTIQSVVLIFLNPFNAAYCSNVDTSNKEEREKDNTKEDNKDNIDMLDKNVIMNVYNNVLDKRAYKLIMIQIVYLIVNSEIELSNFKFSNKIEISEINPYYTMLLFDYFNNMIKNNKDNNDKENNRENNKENNNTNKDDKRLDLEGFLNSYLNNNKNRDKENNKDSLDWDLENYLNLVLIYDRLYEFEDNYLVSEYLEKFSSNLNGEDIFKILLVILVKKLYNKKLLFNIYKRIKYLDNSDLDLLFVFTLSNPDNMDNDYVYLKYNFPKYYHRNCSNYYIENNNKNNKENKSKNKDNKEEREKDNKENKEKEENKEKQLKLENLYYFMDLLNEYNLSMSFLSNVDTSNKEEREKAFGNDKDGNNVLKLLYKYMLVNYNNFNKCNNAEDCFRIFYNEENVFLEESNLYDVYEDKELLESADIKEKEEAISKGKNVTRAELDMVKMHKNYVVYKQKLEILNKMVDLYNVVLNLFKYQPEIFRNNFKKLFLVIVKRSNKVNAFEYFNRISLKIIFNEIFNKKISEELLEYFYNKDNSNKENKEENKEKENKNKNKNEENNKEKERDEDLLLLLYENVNYKYLNENFTVFNYIIYQLVSDTLRREYLENNENNKDNNNNNKNNKEKNKNEENKELLDVVYRLLMLMVDNKYDFDDSIFVYIYYFNKNGRDCSELLNGISYLLTAKNLIQLFHLYFLTHVDLILKVIGLFLANVDTGKLVENTNKDNNKEENKNKEKEEKEEIELEMLEREEQLKEFEVIRELNLVDYLKLFQYVKDNTNKEKERDTNKNENSRDEENKEDGIITLFKLYNCMDDENLEVFRSYYVEKYELLDVLKLFNRYFRTFSDENRLSFYRLLESLLCENQENQEEIVLYLFENYCLEGYYDNLLRNVELVVGSMDGNNVLKFAYQLQDMYNNNNKYNNEYNNRENTNNKDNNRDNKNMVVLLTIGILNLKYHENNKENNNNTNKENKEKEDRNNKELLKWNLENLLEAVLRNHDVELIRQTEKLLRKAFKLIELDEEYLTSQIELFFNGSLKNRIYIGTLVLLLRYYYDGNNKENKENKDNNENNKENNKNRDNKNRDKNDISSKYNNSNINKRDNKNKEYVDSLINRLMTINGNASTTYYEQLLDKDLNSEEFDNSYEFDICKVSEFEVNSVLMVERILVEFNQELSNLSRLLQLMSRNVVYLSSFRRLVGYLVSKDRKYFNMVYGMVLMNLNPEKNQENENKDRDNTKDNKKFSISNKNKEKERDNNKENRNKDTNTKDNRDNKDNKEYKEDKNMVLYYNIHLLNVLIVNYTDELLENSLLDVINVINEYVININTKLKNMTKRVVNSFVGLVTEHSIFEQYKSELVNTLVVPNDNNLLSLVESLYSNLDQQRLLKHVQLSYNCNVNFNMDICHTSNKNRDNKENKDRNENKDNKENKNQENNKNNRENKEKEEIEENKREKKRLGLKMDMSLVNYLLLKSLKMSKLKLKLVLISKYLLTRVGSTCNLNYYLNNVISLLLTLLYDPIREIYHNILETVNLFSYQYNLIVYNNKENSNKDNKENKEKEENKREKKNKYIFNEENKENNEKENVVHRLYKRLEEELESRKDEDQLLVCNLISNLLVHMDKEYKYRILNGFYQSILSDLNNYGYLSRDSSRDSSSSNNKDNTNKENKDNKEEMENKEKERDEVGEFKITDSKLIGYINMFIYVPFSCYEVVRVNMGEVLSVLVRLFEYSNIQDSVFYCLTSLILTTFETSNVNFEQYYLNNKENNKDNKEEMENKEKDNMYDNDERKEIEDCNKRNEENKKLIIYYLLYTLYNNFNDEDNEDNNDTVKLILLKLLYLLINPAYVQATNYPLNHSVDANKEFINTPGRESKVLKDEELEKVIWSYIYLCKFDDSDLISTNAINLTKGHNIQSILNNMVLTLIQVLFDNLYYNNNINNKLIANNCLKSVLQKYPHYSNEILKQLLNPPLSLTTFDGSGNQYYKDNFEDDIKHKLRSNKYSIYNIINYINRLEQKENNKDNNNEDKENKEEYRDNKNKEKDRNEEEDNMYDNDERKENERDLILVGSCLGIHSCYSVSSSEMKKELREQLEEVVEFLKGCLKFKKCCQFSLETLTLISSYYSDVLTTTIIPSFLSLFTSSGGTSSMVASKELLLVEEEEESVILSVYYLVYYNNDYFDYIFNQLINIYENNWDCISVYNNKEKENNEENNKNRDNNNRENKERQLLIKKNRMIVKLLLKLCDINGGELILDSKNEFYMLLDLLYYNINNKDNRNNKENKDRDNKESLERMKDNERDKEEDLLDRFIESVSSDNVYKLIYLLIKGILSHFSDNNDEYSMNRERMGDGVENGTEIYFILLVKLLDNKMIINNFIQEYLQFIFHLLSISNKDNKNKNNKDYNGYNNRNNKDNTNKEKDNMYDSKSNKYGRNSNDVGSQANITEDLVVKYSNILLNKLVFINNSKLNIVIDTIHDHLVSDPTNATRLNNEDEKEFFSKQNYILQIKTSERTNINECKQSGTDGGLKPSSNNTGDKSSSTATFGNSYQECKRSDQDIWVSVIDTCLGYLNNLNNLNLNTNSIEILLVLSYDNVRNFKKHSLKLIGIIIRLLNTLSSANNTSKEIRVKLMKLLNNLTTLDVESYRAITSQLLSTLTKTTFEPNISFLSVNCLYKLLIQLPHKTPALILHLLSGCRKDESKEDKRVINNNLLILINSLLNNTRFQDELTSLDPESLVNFIMVCNNNSELVLSIVKRLYSVDAISETANGCTLSKYEDLLLQNMLNRSENLNELDVKVLMEIINLDTIKNNKFTDVMEHLKYSNSLLYQSFYIQLLHHIATNIPIQCSNTFDLLVNYLDDTNLNNEKNNDKLLKVFEVLLTSKYCKKQHQSIILNRIIKINNEQLSGVKLGFVCKNVNLKLLYEENFINEEIYQFYAQLFNS